MGELLTAALMEFFSTGQLLKQINAATITMIPKRLAPRKVTKYMPISCCNVVYKCIAKILAERLKKCLPNIISLNQSAFVQGMKIIDNILLAQKVVKNYHNSKGKPRCTIKLDIMKAFDSINWDFVLNILIVFGFPSKFIHWIRICITTPMYSVKISGALEGCFAGKISLR